MSLASPAIGMIRESIRIDNRIEEIARVVKRVEAFGEDNDLPRSVVNDVNLALDEVLNNVISYAYADAADHPIAVGLSFDGAAVTAVVTDDGVPFDPLQAPRPTPDPDLKKRRVGGVGIHFVRSLMDHCDYSRKNGQNVLTLTKHVA